MIEATKSVESPLDAAIILLLIMLGAGTLTILAFVTIPDKNLPIFSAFGAALITGPIGAYVGFRWGSSKGSQDKDATIATMAASTGDGKVP